MVETQIKKLEMLSQLDAGELPVVLAMELQDQSHLMDKKRSIRRMIIQDEKDDAETL